LTASSNPGRSARSGADRTVRLRDADRGEDPGRNRRRRAIPLPPCLRPPQWHRPGPGLVRQPRTASAVSNRESAAQHRPAPHRHHPGPLPPASARVPPTPPSRRRHQDRIDPRTQTTSLRRRLPRVAGRRLTPSSNGSDHRGRLTEEQEDTTRTPAGPRNAEGRLQPDPSVPWPRENGALRQCEMGQDARLCCQASPTRPPAQSA
jgi:hypothetical protein